MTETCPNEIVLQMIRKKVFDEQRSFSLQIDDQVKRETSYSGFNQVLINLSLLLKCRQLR